MHKKKQKKTVIIKMATGGLMGQPPYIAKDDKEDDGINPYDVNTPESARQGLPSRLLSKKRTRFKNGGMLDRQQFVSGGSPISDKDLEKAVRDFNLQAELSGNDSISLKEMKELIGKDITKSKKFTVKKAKGGIMDRQYYNQGDEVEKLLRDIDLPDDLEEGPAEGDIPGETMSKMIVDKINRLEKQKDATNNTSLKAKLNNEIKSLETKVRVKAAAGGYMDENQIAEETPLALSLGGTVDRKDYQAYAEGDMVEDESLLAPMGMEDDMMAETDTEMMAEDDMMEDDMDADGILDTSALSEEEETVLDEAMEMHPELEAIIPKIVATEFTEDELVEGPGDGTSDSIPALLSDGEFIFTAKAVKNLGVDTLRDMMAQAEADYDAGLNGQEEEDSLLA